MAIRVQCQQCNKAYQVADRLAGKKVRCKACGGIMSVPAAATSAGPVPLNLRAEEPDLASGDLGALAGIEESMASASGSRFDSFVDDPSLPSAAVPPPPPIGVAARGVVQSTQAASDDAGGEDDSAAVDDSLFGHFGRARATFPEKEKLAAALPFVLTLVGLMILAATAVRAAGDPKQIRPWLVYIRFGLILALYAAVIIPISLAAIHAAGRKWAFTLHGGAAWWKLLAAFFIPLGLAELFHQLSGPGGYAIGFVLGLPVALFSIWLLFPLQMRHAVRSIMTGGVTFVVATIGAALIAMLVNFAITEGLKQYDRGAIAESSKPSTPKPKPAVTAPVESVTSATTKPSDTSPAPATQPATERPMVAIANDPFASNPHAPTVTPPPPPTPTDNHASVAPPEPRKPEPTIVPEDNKPPTEASPSPAGVPAKIITAPFIAELSRPAEPVGFERIIYPSQAAPWMAVVKRSAPDEDEVERWNAQSLERVARTSFKHEPNVRDKYTFSPNGDYLVRITSWPQLSAQVWSFEADQLLRAIELNTKFGTPEVVAFAGPELFIIHWARGGEHGLEIWNAKNGQNRKQIAVPTFENLSGNIAVSPDGKTLAFATRSGSSGGAGGAGGAGGGAGGREGGFGAPGGFGGRDGGREGGRGAAAFETSSQLQLYDLSQNAPRVPRRLNINGLDPRWPLRPSGIAFSSDNSRVAILFERNNNGLLLCWQLSDGKLLYQHTYPGGLLPGRRSSPGGNDGDPARGFEGGGGGDGGGGQRFDGDQKFIGRALDWISDDKAWLVYGSGVFDVESGRLLGQIGLSDVKSQRVTDKATCHLVYETPDHVRRLAVVKLDPEKLAAAKAARRGAAPGS